MCFWPPSRRSLRSEMFQELCAHFAVKCFKNYVRSLETISPVHFEAESRVRPQFKIPRTTTTSQGWFLSCLCAIATIIFLSSLLGISCLRIGVFNKGNNRYSCRIVRPFCKVTIVVFVVNAKVDYQPKGR